MYFTFGPGVVMLAAAAVLLIMGIIFLIKLLRTDWNMSVGAFNARFAHESSLGMNDMELDSKRREIARKLGVSAAMPTQAEFGGSSQQAPAGAGGRAFSGAAHEAETEVMDQVPGPAAGPVTETIGGPETEVLAQGESTEEL